MTVKVWGAGRRRRAPSNRERAKKNASRAERLVAAVRAKGSDADDPRDAAHEACHALQWNIKGKWTRDNIDRKKPYKGARLAWGIRDEITARAVEALVCAELGVEYKQDTYILLAIMETLKLDGIALPSFEWLKDAVVERMGTDVAKEMVQRVLALADEVS